MGVSGTKGTKGDHGQKGETGTRGLDGEKGQKGDVVDVNNIMSSITSPVFPAINFLYDQTINLNEQEISGSDSNVGVWIYTALPNTDLWEGSKSLLIEYYIQDETNSSDWKLEFTETSDSKIDSPKVAVGPVFGSKTNISFQTYIGQVFVPISSSGQLAFKFSCSREPTINLVRLRVVGFV